MDQPTKQVFRQRETAELPKYRDGRQSPVGNGPHDQRNERTFASPEDSLSSPSSEAIRHIAMLHSKAERSSDAFPGPIDAFPTPKLSPSQQRALIRHKLRLLDARVHQSPDNEEQKFDWKATLRDMSPARSRKDRVKMKETSVQEIQLLTGVQSRGEFACADSRKSPLSQHVDELIGAIRTKLTSSGDAVENKLASLSGKSPLLLSASEPGSAYRASFSSDKGRNTSRQLDFDSDNISFAASPLKLRDRHSAFEELVSAQVSEDLPCMRTVAADQVLLPPFIFGTLSCCCNFFADPASTGFFQKIAGRNYGNQIRSVRTPC